VSGALVLAQADNGFFRNRSGESNSCVERNGFCPRWIVHHLDRYVSPFWQHLFLVAVSVALGFAIASGLALLAHRWRHLVSPITQITGILYTIPSLAFFFLLLPITGRGMGLTDRQLLWRVELPLALPAIMAGLRIAATTTVARRSSSPTSRSAVGSAW
jgi:osmoprotectant transport system permease protein